MATRYVVLPHTREAVRALGEAGDALAGELVAMAADELARVRELLATIAAANLATPEPPACWATARRFSTATEETPLPGRIREAALDCLAYRDDVHLAAWSTHVDPATEGGTWNAFSHVWSGEARTAEGIALAAAFRGYDAAFYARALADLEARGWLVADGRLVLRAVGRPPRRRDRRTACRRREVVESVPPLVVAASTPSTPTLGSRSLRRRRMRTE